MNVNIKKMNRPVINKLLFVLWFGYSMMFSTVIYGESMKSMAIVASGISRFEYIFFGI